jgi:hypothetical protein
MSLGMHHFGGFFGHAKVGIVIAAFVGGTA